MTRSLRPLDRPSIEYICYNLRERDKLEIYNVRPHDSPMQLAWEAHAMLQSQGRGTVAWLDGRPVAVIGFVEQWRGLWEAMAFGTDDFRAVAVDLMRWGRKMAAEILKDVGGRRLQADSRVEHTEAHAFIRAMGGQPEGAPMRNYGKDGGSYQRFVWFTGQEPIIGITEADNVLRRRRQQERLGQGDGGAVPAQ